MKDDSEIHYSEENLLKDSTYKSALKEIERESLLIRYLGASRGHYSGLVMEVLDWPESYRHELITSSVYYKILGDASQIANFNAENRSLREKATDIIKKRIIKGGLYWDRYKTNLVDETLSILGPENEHLVFYSVPYYCDDSLTEAEIKEKRKDCINELYVHKQHVFRTLAEAFPNDMIGDQMIKYREAGPQDIERVRKYLQKKNKKLEIELLARAQKVLGHIEH